MATSSPSSITGALAARNSRQIAEIISESSRLIMPTFSPVFEEVIGSGNRIPTAKIGRDWKYFQDFDSIGGPNIQGAQLNSYLGLQGDATAAFGDKGYVRRASAVSAWNDPFGGYYGKSVQVAYTLFGHLVNQAISLSDSRLDNLPANNKNFVSNILLGYARGIAERVAVEWFLDSENKLGTISNVSASNSADTVTFTVSEGTISRFHVGQQVDVIKDSDSSGFGGTAYDLVNSSDGTYAGRSDVRVVGVSALNNTVRLQFDPTAAIAVESVVLNGQWVVPAGSIESNGSAFNKIYGWREYLVPQDPDATGNGATILRDFADTTYKVSVNDWPEFASFYKSGYGTFTMKKWLDTMRTVSADLKAYAEGFTLDTAMFGEGIIENALSQLIATRYRDGDAPLGFTGMPQGNYIDTFQMALPGMTLNVRSTSYLESDTIIGFRTSGNWDLLVPPTADGTNGVIPNNSVPNWLPLEFVAPARGSNTIMEPIYKTVSDVTRTTEHMAIPAYLNMQVIPREQFKGFVLKGVTYDQYLSDDGPVSEATV